MSPSLQTMTDEFKSLVITEVDLEDQDNSTLIEMLPHLVNQDSKSGVNTNCMISMNELSVSIKKLSIDTLIGNEGGRAEKK